MKNRLRIFGYIIIVVAAIFISTSVKNVDFSKLKTDLFHLGNSSKTITVNYVGVGGEAKNAPNTIASDKKSGSITYQEKQYGYFQFDITGLETNKVYKASTIITTNVQENDNNCGGVIGTIRNNTFSNIVFSWSNQVINKTEESSVFFVSDDEGRATIFIGTPYGPYSGCKMKGTVSFSNLSISEASTDDVRVINSKNGKIRLIIKNSDYNSISTKGSDSATASKKYADKLEEVYESFSELVGNTDYSNQHLYPFKNMGIYINYSNQHCYAGLAGYPIEMSYDPSTAISEYDKYGYMEWAPLHEIGHTFDESLSSTDRKYKTKKWSWNFDLEFWGSFKSLYAIDKGIVKTKEDYFKLFENGYNNTMANTSNRTYSGDGVSHLLVQTKNSKGEIDWEALKKTFKWFNDNAADNVGDSGAEKFVWFVKKYSEFSSDGYTNISDVLQSHAAETQTIKDNFNYKPITNIEISEKFLSMQVGDKNKLTTTVLPNESKAKAGLVYKSSNPTVATVDDSGNIEAKKSGVATISAYSFFEQNVKSTVNITVKSSNKGTANKEQEDIKDEPQTKTEITNTDNKSTTNQIVKVSNTSKMISTMVYVMGIISLLIGMFIIYKIVNNKKR